LNKFLRKNTLLLSDFLLAERKGLREKANEIDIIKDLIMNNLMNLPALMLEKLSKDEMVLINGGDKPVVPPPNNGDGVCSGTNNAGGRCSGANNGDGLCGV
jgi:hypothetical protein